MEKVFTGRDPEIIPDLSEVTFDKTVLSVGDTKVLATWDIFSCEIEIEVIAVDWYDLDDTVYINATDLLTALGIELMNLLQQVVILLLEVKEILVFFMLRLSIKHYNMKELEKPIPMVDIPIQVYLRQVV